ncbi:hypothetical protein M3570_21060, partial [Bacillus subtilis]|nr:hypothetical protein [Bacillus subtilis]
LLIIAVLQQEAIAVEIVELQFLAELRIRNVEFGELDPLATPRPERRIEPRLDEAIAILRQYRTE